MKHYSNINNSGYNWSSVPLKNKKSTGDKMLKKKSTNLELKNNVQLEENYVHIYIT